MIDIRGLRKTFGKVVAVDEVSFSAPDASITGLLGPNGAGKTTTLRMLYTLLEPDSGTALVDGVNPSVDPQEVRRRIGVLPDAKGLYPRLTPREHIHYWGGLHGMSGEAIERRCEELLEMLDLRKHADRRCEGFSQGERMKVAIARAVVHDPKNVLLDEPSNGLDVMSTRALRELIRGFREQGRCVLFSSHIMQEVAALCDRIVVIAKGRVVSEGTPDELLAATGKESLEEAFMQIIGTDEGLGT
ncbi:MAG TPA: ATP-binding cassette domain-containing protein [Myxococcaceae bacterium]|nr:ATP-binding cassette domain-containing protein [Myxococcaceae bacterium]